MYGPFLVAICFLCSLCRPEGMPSASSTWGWIEAAVSPLCTIGSPRPAPTAEHSSPLRLLQEKQEDFVTELIIFSFPQDLA